MRCKVINELAEQRSYQQKMKIVLDPNLKEKAKSFVPNAFLEVYRKCKIQSRAGKSYTPKELANPRTLSSLLLEGKSLKIESIKGAHILLCGLPKSASLYSTQLLRASFGLENIQPGFDGRGGEIEYAKLLKGCLRGNNTISHSHCTPTARTVSIIKSLNLKPIVLYRNLLDVIVSRKEMLERDRFAGVMPSDVAIQGFLASSDDEKIRIIIDLFANEYIRFYTGWREFASGNLKISHDQDLNSFKTECLFLTYEEMVANENEFISKVQSFASLDLHPESIKSFKKEMSKTGGINFNRGITGRGVEAVSSDNISILREKAKMLCCADASFLGFEI